MAGDALTKVTAGPFTIRGVSVGGVYTSLWIPELDAVLDTGIALRSSAGASRLFISHAHADHIGALVALLGIRGLHKLPPLQVFMPSEVTAEVEQVLEVMTRLQRYDLAIEAVPMKPGDEQRLRADLWVRAFRTYHPVPSLGYQFFRRVDKLKNEFLSLPGAEIQRRRQAGEPLFYTAEHLELAYATDTLIKILDHNPELFESKVLILECSFLDQKKDLVQSQAGCHIHLDELLERADRFHNEALVLMHFSQLYAPNEVHQLLKQRCPKELFEKLVIFAPDEWGLARLERAIQGMRGAAIWKAERSDLVPRQKADIPCRLAAALLSWRRRLPMQHGPFQAWRGLRVIIVVGLASAWLYACAGAKFTTAENAGNPNDAGVTDAGVTDAGVTDAGVTDAGVTDAGVTDAGVTDAGVTD